MAQNSVLAAHSDIDHAELAVAMDDKPSEALRRGRPPTRALAAEMFRDPA